MKGMRSVLVGWTAVFSLALVGCAGVGTSPLDSPAGRGATAPAGAPRAANAPLSPVVSTEPVPNDADDPAIWVNRANPERSLILGTDKIEEKGGLYVWNLDGKQVQAITPLDRPNNVDVAYGFAFGDGKADIAVVTERKKHRLRVFRIDRESGKLTDASGVTEILKDAEGEGREPMGVTLYTRPRDGAVFAIVSPKAGPADGYLAQYRLEADGNKVNATFVRRFGKFSGRDAMGDGEIEALFADNEAGIVYAADERFGIRAQAADPQAENAGKELFVIGQQGFTADREGIALLKPSGARPVLLAVDQIEGGSVLHAFARPAVGTSAAPTFLMTLPTVADETDGLDATTEPLGPNFPGGVVVMMNSKDRNFLLFDARAILNVANAPRPAAAPRADTRATRPQPASARPSGG